MESLEDMYRGSFFSHRWKLKWRAPYVCTAIVNAYHPKRLIDVGCAIGEYVQEFLKMGVDAYGLEGSKNAIPYLQVSQRRVFIEDLRLPLNLCDNNDGCFDVAMCFEVAEHIEPEYADQFIENLVMLSNQIVMSFAPPGQKGHHHVNCQEAPYWIEKFANCGYVNREDLVEKVRSGFEEVRHRKELRSYYEHLLCLEG